MFFDTADIITLSAIRAPTITAIITGYFQHKTQKDNIHQRRIETVYLHKREVLENYVHALEECRLHPDDYQYKRIYYKQCGAAVLNVSKSVRIKMDRMTNYIQHHNFDKVNEELSGLISDIADEINRTLK